MRILRTGALTLLLLFTGAALAEITIDPATATMDELIATRDLLNAEISAREAAMTEAPTQTAAAADENVSPYSSGAYRVGPEIPAGLYAIYPDEGSRVSSISVRATVNGEEQLLVFESVRTQMAVELSDGQKLELVNAHALPLDASPEVDPSNDEICNGGYLVGVHLPAGQYRLTPLKGTFLPSYSVQTGPAGASTIILTFSVVHEPTEISLEDGNYIQLNDCLLTPLP